MNTTLREVVVRNRQTLNLARYWNRRIGKNVFPVPSRAELARTLEGALKGAFTMKPDFDPETIAVPPLDPDKVRKFSELCPETIEVLGRTWSVSYPQFGPPGVVVQLCLEDAVEILEKPPEQIAVKLPDGRAVEVILSFGTRTYRHSDLSLLRDNLAEDCLDALWTKWVRPDQEIPEAVTQGEGELPGMVTVEWAKHPLTGETLYVFGVLCVSPFAIRMRLRNAIKWNWFRSKEQAILEESLSKTAFLNYRKDLQTEALRLKAEQARAQRFEEKYQKRVEAAQQNVKKSDYLVATKGMQVFGYLVVRDNTLWINCDEQGKVRNMEVSPSLGHPVELDVEVPEASNYWLPIRWDTEINFRSPLLWGRAASLLEPFTMKIAKGKLSNGVWAFGKSGDLYFFPAIYSTGGVEVVPEEVRRVEEIDVL